MEGCLIPANVVFECILPRVRAFDRLLWKRVCRRWYEEMKRGVPPNFWAWKYNQRMVHVVYWFNSSGDGRPSEIYAICDTQRIAHIHLKDARLHYSAANLHITLEQRTVMMVAIPFAWGPPNIYCKECGELKSETDYAINAYGGISNTFKSVDTWKCSCVHKRNLIYTLPSE